METGNNAFNDSNVIRWKTITKQTIIFRTISTFASIAGVLWFGRRVMFYALILLANMPMSFGFHKGIKQLRYVMVAVSGWFVLSWLKTPIAIGVDVVSFITIAQIMMAGFVFYMLLCNKDVILLYINR